MHTRIEVPLSPPPPQFDDERTIATARQVKPIGRARVSLRWRQVRALLPLLFLATLCGALGAAAVNYYDRRRGVEVQAPPQSEANKAVTVQTKSEPTPLATAASNEVNGSKAVIENKAVEVEQSCAKHDEQMAGPEASPSRDENPSANLAPNAPKTGTDSDAAKLTRKRRVQQAEETTPRTQKNGAARISDIFSGPNP